MNDITSRYYQEALKQLGLENDPFPIEAPENIDYWADLRSLFSKLLKLQIRDLLSPISRIYVYWGPLGTGKTHACRYFSNEKTFKEIIEAIAEKGPIAKILPISVVSPIPKRTGDLTYAIFKDIVSKLLKKMNKENYKELATLTEKPELPCIKALYNLAKKTQQTLLEEEYSPFDIVEKTDEFKFLMTRRSTEYGVLETTTDMSLIIRYIIKALLKTYDRLVIWIDELEHLAESTKIERLLFSDLVRKVYDEVDYGLTVILIFSCDTFAEVSELLMPAIWNRVGEDKMEFTFMKEENELIDYLKTNIRTRGGVDPSTIIEDEAAKMIVEKIKEECGERGISPRDFNKRMQDLFASAYLVWKRQGANHFKISVDLVKSIEKQKELIEEIAKKLLGE